MPLVYAENIRLVEVEEQCLIYEVDGSLCKLCIMLSKAILRVKALKNIYLPETAQPSILNHEHINAIFDRQNFQKS